MLPDLGGTSTLTSPTSAMVRSRLYSVDEMATKFSPLHPESLKSEPATPDTGVWKVAIIVTACSDVHSVGGVVSELTDGGQDAARVSTACCMQSQAQPTHTHLALQGRTSHSLTVHTQRRIETQTRQGERWRLQRVAPQ